MIYPEIALNCITVGRWSFEFRRSTIAEGNNDRGDMMSKVVARRYRGVNELRPHPVRKSLYLSPLPRSQKSIHRYENYQGMSKLTPRKNQRSLLDSNRNKSLLNNSGTEDSNSKPV